MLSTVADGLYNGSGPASIHALEFEGTRPLSMQGRSFVRRAVWSRGRRLYLCASLGSGVPRQALAKPP